MAEHLLIGGPLDGQRRTVEHPERGYFEIHERIDSNNPPGLPLRLCARPRYKSSFYHKEQFRAGEKTFEYYLHQEMTPAEGVAALLANYRPNADLVPKRDAVLAIDIAIESELDEILKTCQLLHDEHSPTHQHAAGIRDCLAAIRARVAVRRKIVDSREDSV